MMMMMVRCAAKCANWSNAPYNNITMLVQTVVVTDLIDTMLHSHACMHDDRPNVDFRRTNTMGIHSHSHSHAFIPIPILIPMIELQ